ncbi:hypothetical protein BAXH7_03224 [Bacillus amyloliquefaciens XH7]|nr:hypothetical protein LL3_03242 [Bacillus amyloliquefaciens LL3]AEK90340.1 hypothetical protein BAXH7_03224 [Bacillus amyloliquefaciens XH7]
MRTLSKYLRESWEQAQDCGMARRKQDSMDTHKACGGLLLR